MQVWYAAAVVGVLLAAAAALLSTDTVVRRVRLHYKRLLRRS